MSVATRKSPGDGRVGNRSFPDSGPSSAGHESHRFPAPTPFPGSGSGPKAGPGSRRVGPRACPVPRRFSRPVPRRHRPRALPVPMPPPVRDQGPRPGAGTGAPQFTKARGCQWIRPWMCSMVAAGRGPHAPMPMSMPMSPFMALFMPPVSIPMSGVPVMSRSATFRLRLTPRTCPCPAADGHPRIFPVMSAGQLRRACPNEAPTGVRPGVR